jgi:hypothetical protein
MLKNNRFTIIGIIIISAITLSFSIDLEYRNVVNGKLKILIPKGFIHVPKGSYKLHYEGEPAPDDFYCNKDTSESVSFLKSPQYLPDVSACKQFSSLLQLNPTFKVHYNDTITVNGNKMYLIDMEAMDVGKLRYGKMFFININNTTYVGEISCNVALKKAWLPVSDRILKSIKVN